MSLHPQQLGEIPSETIRVAQLAFPKGNIYLRMRDELGVFYADQDFIALFSPKGQPAFSPWRLALITVMQYVEGLTDRQAADAVRGRLDWKYALGLELTDSGFDFSVLSEFRARLIQGGLEQQLFEKMLDIFQEKELLKSPQKQRTDSTHILAAIRVLAQGTRAFGLRFCRYRGLTKTRLQHIITACAINLVRVWSWWTDAYIFGTNPSRLAALAP